MSSIVAWLEVAAEIRCNVYKEFFRSVDIEVHGNHKLIKKRKRGKDYYNNNISILLTCKIVNEEADPYFFSESKFVIKDCHCWRNNPETRPRRLKEIQYLNFDTTASEAHWVSLWFELINPTNAITPTLSNIKDLNISYPWCMETFEDMLWIFDAIKGRFRHFELLVDVVGEDDGHDYCTIIINQNHDITVTGVEMTDLQEIKGVLVNDCATISDEKVTLLLKGGNVNDQVDEEEEDVGDDDSDDGEGDEVGEGSEGEEN